MNSAPLSLPWPDRLIEAGALFLLVFTPLAFGTVEPWSEAIAELVVLSMALTYVIGNLRDWELRADLPPGWLPALGFLALVVLQAVIPGWSADPHATRREALKLLALAAFFLICWNTYRTRAQAERALWTMIGVGTFIALFGIVQRMTWTGRLYWIGPEAPGSAFGPFVNRAHFAGLMVVIVPMALALVLGARRDAAGRKRLARRWRDKLRQWNSSEADPARLVPFLVVLMGGAALVSGSRGGMVALLAALLAMVGLIALGRSGRRHLVPVAVVAGLIVLGGVWMGSDIMSRTAERLAQEVGEAVEGTGESPRLRIWADALELWREAPVVGTGLASFGATFPRVRTIQAPVAYTHAESDWVQLLTDTGVLGLALTLGVAGTLALVLLRRRRQAASPWARTLALAGLVALIGAAVQGIGNYGVPVLSNLVFVVMALIAGLQSGLRQGAGES